MERKMTTDVPGNMKVPEAAREFIKSAASAAKERAADAQVGVEKVTAAIESAAANSVNEAAKVSRAIQNTVYQEVDAALDGIQKLSTAKSFSEIIHVQSDYFHNRVDAMAARSKAIGEYLSELVHEAAHFANRTSSKGSRLDAQAI
jgi:phasin